MRKIYKTERSRYNEKEITKMHKKLNRRNPVRVFNMYEKVSTPMEELLVTVGTLCETSERLIHSFRFCVSSEDLVLIINALHKNIDKRIQLLLKSINNKINLQNKGEK